MRFAFAGIDFLGDAFLTLIERGWQPVKLFSRPCDGIYDFNEATIARAYALRVPVQTSRIRPADLAALGGLGCEALVIAGYPWLVTGWEEHIPYAVNFHPSPLPEGRGPYPLFQAILEGRRDWGVSVHALKPAFDTGPILAQDRFPLGADETHDTLLARCQMAVTRLSARLSTELPDLWANAAAQGAGSYWPRVTERRRTLDWGATVAEVLRTVRAFGSIETIANVGGKRLYVWSATGWTEAHRLAPGTLAHKHRRHLVIAVRDGFIQLTGWSTGTPRAQSNVDG